MDVQALLIALAAGVLPALIWLFFLLREDAEHPESRRMILLAFVAGMGAVFVALPFEQVAEVRLGSGLPVLTAWAIIEETLKYAAAAALILWRCNVDEPLDYVIYLIVIGLGFAALENMFFLLAPFAGGDVATGVLTGSLRFMGSTLLHILASACIGFALAFSYHLNRILRSGAAIAGLILASSLHAFFNFLIISEDGKDITAAFLLVWTGIVVSLALMEVLRYRERLL